MDLPHEDSGDAEVANGLRFLEWRIRARATRGDAPRGQILTLP
jgi:hypothetical protein